MSARKNVSASVVRDFAATPEGAQAILDAGAKMPGQRGGIDPMTITVFHKENPRLRYDVASGAGKPTITVPVTGLDKRGRKHTKKVTLTTEAARAALGHPKGRRGRFNHGELSRVLSEQAQAQAKVSV